MKLTPKGCPACGPLGAVWAGAGVAAAGVGVVPKTGIKSLAWAMSKSGESNCALAQPAVCELARQQIYHQAPSSLRESTVTTVFAVRLPSGLKFVPAPSRTFRPSTVTRAV